MAALTTAQKLVEAEDALHKLMTGQAVRVFVDQNGERVEFTTASAGKLRGYIAELTATIAGRASPGSIGFFF